MAAADQQRAVGAQRQRDGEREKAAQGFVVPPNLSVERSKMEPAALAIAVTARRPKLLLG